MKSTPCRGQVLPLLFFLLVPLIFFIGANGERLLRGVGKIDNQKEADVAVLTIVNEQVRAFNAIAALNQGLKIARDRGYAVAIALLTLEACTMMIIPPPPCVAGLARLGAKAVPFFKKLSKLGKELAKQQDEIASWAAQRPLEILKTYNLTHIGKNQLFLYPNQFKRLPIRREGTESSSGLDPSPQALGDGQDLKKCDVLHFDTYENFKKAREDGRIVVRKNDSLTVEYRDSSTDIRKMLHPKTTLEVRNIGPTRYFIDSGSSASFYFQNAALYKCQSFYDILNGFGFGGLVQIPRPYLLEQRFFEGENRIGLARVTKSQDASLDRLLKFKSTNPPKRSDSWALSEAEMDGGDLTKMEFLTILSSLSLAANVWEVVMKNAPYLMVTGFEPPPAWSQFHASLRH